MLRALILSGVLLMAVGFGAAGWQYWRAMPAGSEEVAAGERETAPTETERGPWLASDTGAVVARDLGLAYLDQNRLVPGRMLVLTRTAPLSALLGEGESLPEPVFLEVMADIRAPVLADGVCAALTVGPAADCAMHSARVVPGSVDAGSGTARFQLEFAYRLKPEEGDLPDPATQVFRNATLPWVRDPESGALSDPGAAVAALAAAAGEACAALESGEACRIIGLGLDWTSPEAVSGEFSLGWLDALPQGIEAAPPLVTPAPEN
jgi:hypothetical protein